MGHHTSKQQHQQMPDDEQQMTNSVVKQQKTLVKTATNLLFVKKPSRSTGSAKVKKSKRSAKSLAATVTEPPNPTVEGSTSSALAIPQTSVDSKANQPFTEACSGSVVITIRLLKMESSERSSGDAPADYSNRVSIHSIERSTDNDRVTAFSIAQQMLANNGRMAKATISPSGSALNDVDSINFRETVYSSQSDAFVCDNECGQGANSEFDETNATVRPTVDVNKPPNLLNESNSITVVSDTAKVLPAQIIGDVSPYPHHIPIANVLRNTDSSIEQIVASHNQQNNNNKQTKSKKQNWGIKFNCAKLKGMKSSSSASSCISQPSSPCSPTPPSSPPASNVSKSRDTLSFEQNESNASMQSTTLLLEQSTLFGAGGGNLLVVTMDQPLLELARFSSEEYQVEDCDKQARLQRAIEIEEGVEAPPSFISTSSLQSLHSISSSNLHLLSNDPFASNKVSGVTLRLMGVALPGILHQPDTLPRIHSQVDYMHCLVPDLMQITNCSFYWGKMDRYEAERLLENKPEGTFLLRDSAQEEFLFSVSFRKYGRSLHARIEQFNNEFSFDCHDPEVYTSKTVTGLLEHYKDPACVMFFEPALTLPLNRNFVFSLQQLCRATIVSHTTYDGINEICLPIKLKGYLKEYHYKQRVRLRRYDESIYSPA